MLDNIFLTELSAIFNIRRSCKKYELLSWNYWMWISSHPQVSKSSTRHSTDFIASKTQLNEILHAIKVFVIDECYVILGQVQSA